MFRAIGGYVRRHGVAYLALFVALGGTSYAATRLAPGSVGTPQIRNGSVTMAKLSPSIRPSKHAARFRDAVAQVVTDPTTGIDISVHATDGAPGQMGPQGPAGVGGQAGPQGDTGATGAQGPPGAAPAVAHIADDGTVLWSSTGTVEAAKIGDYYCLRVTGGGLSAGTVTLEDNGAYTDQAFVSKPGPSTCVGYDLAVRIARVTGPDVSIVAHPFFIALD
jgi:hypothetical protein